ncbi:MAG TPA: S1 RNA-binding domain-containing protein [Chthoniobacterales bacterium]|nr:S1 RNA-binding domain-containing protein [Chthoniobacterales bacterium]
MRLRSPAGLADLALACARLCPPHGRVVEQIAGLLGLTAVDPIQVAIASAMSKSSSPTALPNLATTATSVTSDVSLQQDALTAENEYDEEIRVPTSPLRRELEASRVWGPSSIVGRFASKRPVRAESGEIPKSIGMPGAIAEAEPWPQLIQGLHNGQSMPALIPPGTRRTFLRDAVATVALSTELDTSQLVDQVARGRWLRRLPKKTTRRVVRPPEFLIDVSESMTTFVGDAKELVGLAQAVLGSSSSCVTWTSGPPDATFQDDTRPWPVLFPGDTLVVVSLLGLGTGRFEKDEWDVFARNMYRRGVHLVALTPALSSHWSGVDVRRWWKFVPWMPPGRRHRLNKDEQLEKLAILFSVITDPDPVLLRQVRLRCFPEVEPYLESRLIESKWVTAAYRNRFLMNHCELPFLQEKLAASPSLLAEARELSRRRQNTQGLNETDPAAIAEGLWMDALSSDSTASQRVHLALARLIKTLHEHPDQQSLARFGYSVLQRLPLSVRKSYLGRLANLLVQTGLQQQLDQESIVAAVEHQSWLYPTSVAVGVAWNGHTLFLRDRPRSGDAIITIPDTPRRQIRVDWGRSIGTEWRSFFRVHRIAAPDLPVAVLTLRGQSFALNQPDETGLWRALRQSLQTEEIISGKVVTTVTRGAQLDGYLVDVGLAAFLPASQVTLDGFIDDTVFWLGETINVVVTQLDRGSRTVVVSRSRALVQTERKAIVEFLRSLETGQKLDGRVVRVTKGAVVVNVGPVNSYVPVDDLSWDASVTPADFALVGDEFPCVVVSVDCDRQQLRLSRKLLTPDPWLTLDRFSIGTTVKCRVRNLRDFGAFVELDKGIVGLIHATDITWRSDTEKPSDVLEIGQEIDAVVLKIDKTKRRISLGIKQLRRNPWLDIADRFPVGTIVKGTVCKFAPYGAFVELAEGIQGMIHVSNLTWAIQLESPSKVLAIGQEIEAIVLEVDASKKRVSLGIKQLQPDPWFAISDRFPVGSKVRGTVRNIVAYGAFLELDEGIQGMIHVTDLSWMCKVKHPSELFNKGQEVQAVVLGIDEDTRRISLGTKQLEGDPWAHVDQLFALGALVRGKVSKIVSFGAFVELKQDFEGLLHISEIAEEPVVRVKDKLQVGDEVAARVIDIDKVERRIGLSIKAME